MAIIKTQADGLNLADDFTFTGKLSGQNYPAFEAYLSGNQTVTDAVTTLIQFDTEIFDTDNAFNNTATGNGYSFTVPTGKDGKYFIFSRLLHYSGAVSNLNYGETSVYVNGSVIGRASTTFTNNDAFSSSIDCNMILDLSAGDYIQVYGRVDINSGTAQIIAGSGARILDSAFGAYRIGD